MFTDSMIPDNIFSLYDGILDLENDKMRILDTAKEMKKRLLIFEITSVLFLIFILLIGISFKSTIPTAIGCIILVSLLIYFLFLKKTESAAPIVNYYEINRVEIIIPDNLFNRNQSNAFVYVYLKAGKHRKIKIINKDNEVMKFLSVLQSYGVWVICNKKIYI